MHIRLRSFFEFGSLKSKTFFYFFFYSHLVIGQKKCNFRDFFLFLINLYHLILDLYGAPYGTCRWRREERLHFNGFSSIAFPEKMCIRLQNFFFLQKHWNTLFFPLHISITNCLLANTALLRGMQKFLWENKRMQTFSKKRKSIVVDLYAHESKF